MATTTNTGNSAPPAVGFSSSNNETQHQIPGTSPPNPKYTAFAQREHGFMENYQSINFMKFYRKFSFEELRFQDYKQKPGYTMCTNPKIQDLKWKCGILNGESDRNSRGVHQLDTAAVEVITMESVASKLRKLALSDNRFQAGLAPALGLILSPVQTENLTTWSLNIQADGDLILRLVVPGKLETQSDGSSIEDLNEKAGKTTKETHYNFRVSSDTLIQASPVFRALLGKSGSGGMFKEGIEFEKVKIASKIIGEQAEDDNSTVEPYILTIEDDDPVALNLILSMLPHDYRALEDQPMSVPFSLLFQVAVICDKYDCASHPSLQESVRKWVSNHLPPGGTERANAGGFLYIAWVFGLKDLFFSLTRKQIMEMRIASGMAVDDIFLASTGKLDLSCWPGMERLPDRVLNAIFEKQQSILTAIIKELEMCKETRKKAALETPLIPSISQTPAVLCKGVQKDISCDVILYGTACRALILMERHKVLQEQSIQEVCDGLANMVVYHLFGHADTCDFKGPLLEKVSQILDDVKGLDLADFLSKK